MSQQTHTSPTPWHCGVRSSLLALMNYYFISQGANKSLRHLGNPRRWKLGKFMVQERLSASKGLQRIHTWILLWLPGCLSLLLPQA